MYTVYVYIMYNKCIMYTVNFKTVTIISKQRVTTNKTQRR